MKRKRRKSLRQKKRRRKNQRRKKREEEESKPGLTQEETLPEESLEEEKKEKYPKDEEATPSELRMPENYYDPVIDEPAGTLVQFNNRYLHTYEVGDHEYITIVGRLFWPLSE